MYKHRRRLKAGNFRFRKKKNCTIPDIPVAKTKALISFAITAKLICAFGFAYADCWFSHEEAQMKIQSKDEGASHCTDANGTLVHPGTWDVNFQKPTRLKL